MSDREADVVQQLEATGYLSYMNACDTFGTTYCGTIQLCAVTLLMNDPRFANGVLYALHQNVGKNLHDFRSYKGTFGKGSLQLVIDRTTGKFYADIDKYNPYADVVNFLGHTFWEVVPQWFRRRPRIGK